MLFIAFISSNTIHRLFRCRSSYPFLHSAHLQLITINGIKLGQRRILNWLTTIPLKDTKEFVGPPNGCPSSPGIEKNTFAGPQECAEIKSNNNL
ncbi:hypothetical protein LXL04_034147 [Taraxacum kok-saghyz]